MKEKRSSVFSIAAGIGALILSLSCCWLPAVIVALGGATSMMAVANGLESYSGVLMIVGALLMCYGGFRYYRFRQQSMCCADDKQSCC